MNVLVKCGIRFSFRFPRLREGKNPLWSHQTWKCLGVTFSATFVEYTTSEWHVCVCARALRVQVSLFQRNLVTWGYLTLATEGRWEVASYLLPGRCTNERRWGNSGVLGRRKITIQRAALATSPGQALRRRPSGTICHVTCHLPAHRLPKQPACVVISRPCLPPPLRSSQRCYSSLLYPYCPPLPTILFRFLLLQKF